MGEGRPGGCFLGMARGALLEVTCWGGHMAPYGVRVSRTTSIGQPGNPLPGCGVCVAGGRCAPVPNIGASGRRTADLCSGGAHREARPGGGGGGRMAQQMTQLIRRIIPALHVAIYERVPPSHRGHRADARLSRRVIHQWTTPILQAGTRGPTMPPA